MKVERYWNNFAIVQLICVNDEKPTGRNRTVSLTSLYQALECYQKYPYLCKHKLRSYFCATGVRKKPSYYRSTKARRKQLNIGAAEGVGAGDVTPHVEFFFGN